MLIDFAISNFRSIREEQTLSLLAAKALKELPENLLPCELAGMKRERVLRSAAIYGPNAAGKSTLLIAMLYLRALVSGRTNNNPGESTKVTPFALDNSAEQAPSVFRIHFVASDGIRYEYGVALNKERILQEGLTAYPNGKAQLRFRRTVDEKTGQVAWDGPLATKHLREATRPNALFLTTAIQLNNSELLPIFDWFEKDLFILLETDQHTINGEITTLLLHGRTTMSPAIKAAMQLADLGIVDAQTEEIKIPERSGSNSSREEFPPGIPPESIKFRESYIAVQFMHRMLSGEARALPYQNESRGTLRLYALIGLLLLGLEKGQTLLLDEIDTSLHPLMVRRIIEIFQSPESNPHGAQLIFTTHNPLLLDTQLMRRDQVWFVDKDEGGASHLYPLTDYSPRKDESLVRGYLTGRYGAVPFIPTSLLPMEASKITAKTTKGIS